MVIDNKGAEVLKVVEDELNKIAVFLRGEVSLIRTEEELDRRIVMMAMLLVIEETLRFIGTILG